MPRRPAAVMRTTHRHAAHRPPRHVRHLPVQKKPVLPPLRPHRLPPGRQLRNPGRPALRVTRWMPTARLPLPWPTRQLPHPILQQRVLLLHRRRKPLTARRPRAAASRQSWPPLMYLQNRRAHRPRRIHWLIRYARVPKCKWKPHRSASPSCSNWPARWDWMSPPPQTGPLRPTHAPCLPSRTRPRRTSRRPIRLRACLQATKEPPRHSQPWKRLPHDAHRQHRRTRLSSHRTDAWRPQDARAPHLPCPRPARHPMLRRLLVRPPWTRVPRRCRRRLWRQEGQKVVRSAWAWHCPRRAPILRSARTAARCCPVASRVRYTVPSSRNSLPARWPAWSFRGRTAPRSV